MELLPADRVSYAWLETVPGAPALLETNSTSTLTIPIPRIDCWLAIGADPGSAVDPAGNVISVTRSRCSSTTSIPATFTVAGPRHCDAATRTFRRRMPGEASHFGAASRALSVALDNQGNLYIETAANFLIRRVSA